METIEYSGAIDKSLNLEPVLTTWLGLNRHCVETWEGDVPWRYNERATLSYFVGAIWRSGGFALEEYSTQKAKSKSAGYFFGRGDLWFEIGAKEYDVEAKLCRTRLNDPFSPGREINRCLKRAIADISMSKKYDDERLGCALAACALVVDVRGRRAAQVPFGDELKARFAQWVDAIKSAGDACAWFIRDRDWSSFPDGARPGFLYPGVAVILKAVHR
jgi:hypothetical protein